MTAIAILSSGKDGTDLRDRPALVLAPIERVEEKDAFQINRGQIARSTHERIDGKGYPDGLPGPDIPLLSRMISIADTYDVMTARDSYRKP